MHKSDIYLRVEANPGDRLETVPPAAASNEVLFIQMK